MPKEKKIFVRSGIRTHAWRTRLRPERSALDRSAILTCWKEAALIVKHVDKSRVPFFYSVTQKKLRLQDIIFHWTDIKCDNSEEYLA